MGRLGLMILSGAAILAALLLVSTIYGTTAIPVSDAFDAIGLGIGLNDGDMSPLHRIVFDLRLPRTLFAAVIGAGLGVVGVVLQTTTRNDLADPFLFGLVLRRRRRDGVRDHRDRRHSRVLDPAPGRVLWWSRGVRHCAGACPRAAHECA